MSSYIFVSIMCIGLKCDFMASTKQVSLEQCNTIKQQFHALPFKPEVTLAAAQCMPFEDKVRI